ncbi:MAG: DUF1007 family protein [Geminicoccaceae bacterium]|nr:MAG: DUF1007 family protein [Geminicoccaceae bacterium]
MNGVRGKLVAASGLAAWLALAPAAVAHPHGWIDIQTKLHFDDAGRLIAIDQAWLFDDLYSAFILEEFAADGLTVEEGLVELGRADIEALADFDYFTVVKRAGEPVPLGRVEHFANGVAANRIWLRFELPLAAPLPMDEGEVRYAVFDPTYFIEILHLGDPPVLFEGRTGCGFELIEPDPPSEMVWLAAALDMGQSGGDGLGAYFAEWVIVQCE